jgi:hypothetical protein
MRTDPFLFHNGRAARSVPELLQIIEESPQALFDEHVTKERNDFAAWLEMGLQEEQLARKLRATTDRIATISILREFLSPKTVAGNSATAARLPNHFLDAAHQKEFLWGLLVGLILGVILLRVVVLLW